METALSILNACMIADRCEFVGEYGSVAVMNPTIPYMILVQKCGAFVRVERISDWDNERLVRLVFRMM